MRRETRIRGLWWGRLSRAVAVGAIVLGSAACSDLLDVELPGDLVEDDVFQQENAALIVNSAIADFECAFSMMSAVLTAMGDQGWPGTGSVFGGTHGDYENQSPGGGNCLDTDNVATSWWHNFERSRLFSETAYARLETEWTSAEDRDRLMATAAVYAAMYYDVIGSMFCEYVYDGEPIVPPSEVLRRGEDWATRALTVMGSGDFEIDQTSSLRQLAYLVRARIRRTLNDGGAMSDAMQVQPGFEALVTRDGSQRGRWNELVYFWNAFKYRTVAGPVWWLGFDDDSLVSAGYWDLTIADDGTGRHTIGDGVPDMRVAETNVGTPIVDGNTPWHRQDIYTSNADPIRMASWQEAQLILAEIEGGQQAVARINAVRASHAQTPPLPDFVSSDADEIFTAIVEERRRELFLQGARHYMDKLRYGLWFPRGRGTNRIGDLYGQAYCLVPPNNMYELNENVPADYTGPDLADVSYTWELEVPGPTSWPIPATLPQFDVMDPDAIPWTEW